MKKALLLAGSAALLSQCAPSTTSTVSVDRYAELSNRATKEPRHYAISVEFHEGKGKGVVVKAPVQTVRPGKEASFAMQREFVYPAAYQLAELTPKLTMKISSSSFPVSPATPTAFTRRDLGYRAVLTAKPQGGFVVVQGSISHEKFVGFSRAPGEAISPIVDASSKVVLTENRVEMPNFVRSETPVFISGLPGVPHVIDLPGIPGSATVTVVPVD
ncbi:hypothetical protein [Haloferula sp. BvORR071]|uniref:hypothetical protein n=1 Tax=Haloferula sp. BvORR071 TaxID=1396141 RepID=UPI00055214E2|nr:hypothetical protein [Haloferula sp. BvORR071]